jgi:hypothetical protein
MTTADGLTACLLGGAIGNAYGSSYEQTAPPRDDSAALPGPLLEHR